MKVMNTIIIFLFFFINQSMAARPFGTKHSHHKHHQLTFLMSNLLNSTPPSQNPPASIPFHKPLGFLPPNGAIPLPQTNPSSSPHLDVADIGISFPARATLQELEFGSLIPIDQDLFDSGKVYGSSVVGRARGVFVANSEDEAEHMVAMTAGFGRSGVEDGLRFFGVVKKDARESHVAVIGGVGKYGGANGYAVIKEVDARSNAFSGEKKSAQKLLLFRVYLS